MKVMYRLITLKQYHKTLTWDFRCFHCVKIAPCLILTVAVLHYLEWITITRSVHQRMSITNEFIKHNVRYKLDWHLSTSNPWLYNLLWRGLKTRTLYFKEYLPNKYPDTEFFLVRILTYLGRIRRFTEKISEFSRNAGKYGPEKTPYLDTFYAVNVR